MDVRVLAPKKFYEPFRLGKLTLTVHRSLKKLAATANVQMSFGFDVLSDECLPGPHLPDDQLLMMLEERVAVTPDEH